ncbi:MAG TPA: tRNA (adenosine(37)-N6)-threonylcarbamoyltransferase complex transferase subunit TsaD [Verrucomicrobiae bacterium]|jgi:N6-L-threonylcarbamoyladenine synthase|nr:tRNA (adenosine(37)-N6)-threonylcarbamoyltransferase complex transferase subunit TsaD [Verrucomicrobiae bacterium]
MKILGIETSCDETAAAVVEDGYRLLSNIVASSMNLHVKYGGVVPEIAARSHIEVIMPVIQQALDEASCTWDDIDGIAVTYGAGLGGSLLIGLLTARTLAIVYGKPLYAINHVEGHVYVNFLTEISPKRNTQLVASGDGQRHSVLGDYTFPSNQPKFPMLAIIVSGGHSQLVLFRDHFDYSLLGQTQDDAIGEAFDKVAKMLGLPYPGGPSIAAAALRGDPKAFSLPKAKMSKYDFSFSGLKTAVLRLAQAQIGESYDFPSTKLPARLSEAQKADIAASFQCLAIETIVDKAKLAYEEFGSQSVVIAGGVAANQELRRQLSAALPLPVEYPDAKLCTDNAAMVATLGCFKVQLRQPVADPYTLAIEPNLSM